MDSAFIESFEHRTGGGGDVADGVILADKALDRVDTLEPHQGLELDLGTKIAAHQVDVTEAWYFARFDPGNNLAANNRFICGSVGRRRPSAPSPTDCHTRIGIST